MANIRIALVSRTDRLSKPQLTRVAAALNKQLKNDFGPAWQITATIEVFDPSQDIPPDYWPVTVRDRIEPEGLGRFIRRKTADRLQRSPMGRTGRLASAMTRWKC